MGLFSTTFRKQITDYLAPVLRGESLIDFLYSVSSPIETALNTEVTPQQEITDKLRYNGQKVVLQAGLNTLLGTATNEVYIVCNRSVISGTAGIGNIGEETVGIANIGEGYPTMGIANTSEVLDKDFTIFVPVAKLATLQDAIEANTDLIKIIGTNYDIQTY